MATRHLSRALQSATKPMSSIFSHSYTTAAIPRSSLSRFRPVVAAATATYVRRLAPSVFTRAFATRQTSSSLNDPNPNWTNRPPKETILLDGCDFEHWLVVMEKPEGDVTRDDIIDSYIKTLAMVIGSEEEARMKIYSVSTKHYFAFGALVPEEVSLKIKELPKVTWVLPDSYLDVRNKDYGGEPFINGQAVPYDPKYHEEWVRNNSRANERNRRNDRPRNNDRSRNFERRNMNSGGGGGGGGNFSGGPPAGNQQIDPKYQSNYPAQSSPPSHAPNAGGMQHQNFANNNPGNYPPRGPPANNNAPNYQYGPSNGQAPYQSSPGSNQAGYHQGTGQGPNHNNVGQAYVPPSAVGGNQFQNQNRGGYVPDGPNQGGYSAPQNAGYGQGQNQNTYGQVQNGYGPQNGGQGQNQGGGYVNPNVAGRDPNY